MQVLRFADRAASRWKNGGGVTREYGVHPEGAGMDDFFWRVSRARVERHGSFSVFSGIDRTLTLIDGVAIDLMMPDRHIRLDATTPPYRFSGDLAIECRIPAGPIEDINVMTRRGRWTHAVEKHAISEPSSVKLAGDVNFLFALAPVRVSVADHAAVDLGHGDALVLERPTSARVETSDGRAEILAIRLDHLDQPWAVGAAPPHR